MKITVTVETDENTPWAVDTGTSVTNTRNVAVGGPHEWEGAISRVAKELAQLATDQLMLTATADSKRRR